MEALEFGPLLREAGLQLRKEHPGAAWLGGGKLGFTTDAVELTGKTLRDTPLYKAGLDEGDHILKWDGKAIKSSAELDGWLTKHRPGDHVRLDVETRIGEKHVEITLAENPNLEIVTFEQAQQGLSREAAQFRQAWLSSKAIHALPHIPAMP